MVYFMQCVCMGHYGSLTLSLFYILWTLAIILQPIFEVFIFEIMSLENLHNMVVSRADNIKGGEYLTRNTLAKHTALSYDAIC